MGEHLGLRAELKVGRSQSVEPSLCARYGGGRDITAVQAHAIHACVALDPIGMAVRILSKCTQSGVTG